MNEVYETMGAPIGGDIAMEVKDSASVVRETPGAQAVEPKIRHSVDRRDRRLLHDR